jgi:hypothetical protein
MQRKEWRPSCWAFLPPDILQSWHGVKNLQISGTPHNMYVYVILHSSRSQLREVDFFYRSDPIRAHWVLPFILNMHWWYVHVHSVLPWLILSSSTTTTTRPFLILKESKNTSRCLTLHVHVHSVSRIWKYARNFFGCSTRTIVTLIETEEVSIIQAPA